MNRLTPVVKKLLIVNVLVFVVIQLLLTQGPTYLPFISKYMMLWKIDAVIDRPYDNTMFLPIQWVSSMFTHFDFLHLGMNMLGLFLMGPLVEMVLGEKRFLQLYLFSGLFQTITTSVFDPSDMPVIGASGALSSLLVFMAIYFPHMKVRMIFPPIEAKARTFALVLIGLEIVLFIADTIKPFMGGYVSHFGHIMGALGGFLFLQKDRIFPGPKR